MRYSYYFFDMDGTVIDSAPGITASVRCAMKKLDRPFPPDADLSCFIGPPLDVSFMKFGGLSREDALRAVAFYRENYRGGAMFDCRVYDGIRETLKALSERGAMIVLATCKPHEFANAILARLGLSPYFSLVAGPELDGTRSEKDEVIAYAMEQLGNPDPASVLMIGDRGSDVTGAAKSRVACAGALWGFGTAEELQAAGAIRLLHTPLEITTF